MKKASIILLFVAIMVLSMTGCAFVPNEVMEKAPAEVIGSGTLKFESKGEYYISKVDKDAVVYSFDYPNNGIVVYQIPGTTFLVTENIDERVVDYVANVYVKNGEFVALSNKYLLFAIPEREGMVAVAITSDAKNEVCPGLLLDYSYDDLTQDEKDAFVFPIERKDLNE